MALTASAWAAKFSSHVMGEVLAQSFFELDQSKSAMPKVAAKAGSKKPLELHGMKIVLCCGLQVTFQVGRPVIMTPERSLLWLVDTRMGSREQGQHSTTKRKTRLCHGSPLCARRSKTMHIPAGS